MRHIRAILIDPFACTVTELYVDGDNLAVIHDLMSHETQRVMEIEAVKSTTLPPGEFVYVDKNRDTIKKPERFFMYPGCLQPYAGKGLVMTGSKIGFLASIVDLVYVETATFFLEKVNEGYVATVDPWKPESTSSVTIYPSSRTEMLDNNTMKINISDEPEKTNDG